MKTVTLEGTQELMKAREVSVILATGGMGLVRAAYSAGKPAYGVGPGNAPCYIESSADVRKAANDILTGKSFDNGVLCSSPNSVVVDQAIEAEARRQFLDQGGYFLSAGRSGRAGQATGHAAAAAESGVRRQVGDVTSHRRSASRCPPNTRALIAELKGVGRDFPLSIEKLCPVLSYYVVKDWREGCERCKQILRYGGMGHTMSIHSQNDAVILEFGLHKPAYRICVNTPTTHGSIGLTTGLDPAMTLGCGGFGGNITSDNITPRHLINIKRVAYELRPRRFHGFQTVPAVPKVSFGSAVPGAPRLPKARAKPQPESIPADALTDSHRSAFWRPRGLAPEHPQHLPAPVGTRFRCPARLKPPSSSSAKTTSAWPSESGRKLLVGERTIVTPAARDAGEAAKVFLHAGWPSP